MAISDHEYKVNDFYGYVSVEVNNKIEIIKCHTIKLIYIKFIINVYIKLKINFVKYNLNYIFSYTYII